MKDKISSQFGLNSFNVRGVKIAVIGLGYVGLPLAVEFAKSGFQVFGFDINLKRIRELEQGIDLTGEVEASELKRVKIIYSNDPQIIKKTNFLIVTVPTPVDKDKKPDLTLIKNASKIVGENLQKGSIVTFESTVYPGVTEEICAPIIEKYSRLKCGKDWKVGYSPERINPGDKEHTISKVIKIVSGMDKESLQRIAQVYNLICKNGIYKAPNIKTAEAAKVIENVQRDLNIALVNELALIFHRLGINTKEVLEAAGTKWNFHKYQPGLVGGHCIGVDPYYLVYKAEELGYHPEVIAAGRRINDYIPQYVADLTVKSLVEAGKVVQGAKILVMGLTFKENVPDVRNSKTKEVIEKLKEQGVEVFGYDPILRKEETKGFGVKNVSDLKKLPKMDGIILCTLHNEFKKLSLKIIKKLMGKSPVLIDVKSYFLDEKPQDQGFIYKCL